MREFFFFIFIFASCTFNLVRIREKAWKCVVHMRILYIDRKRVQGTMTIPSLLNTFDARRQFYPFLIFIRVYFSSTFFCHTFFLLLFSLLLCVFRVLHFRKLQRILEWVTEHIKACVPFLILSTLLASLPLLFLFHLYFTIATKPAPSHHHHRHQNGWMEMEKRKIVMMTTTLAESKWRIRKIQNTSFSHPMPSHSFDSFNFCALGLYASSFISSIYSFHFSFSFLFFDFTFSSFQFRTKAHPL